MDKDFLNINNIINRYTKKYKTNTICIIFFYMIYPIESTLQPYLIGKISKYLIEKDINKIRDTIQYIVLLNVFIMIVYSIELKVNQNIFISLQEMVLEDTLNFIFDNESNVEYSKNTELILSIKQYSNIITKYIKDYVDKLLPTSLSIFYQMLYLYTIDKYLGNLLCILLLSIFYFIFYNDEKCEKTKVELIDVERELYEKIDDILINISTISNTDMYSYEQNNIKDINNKLKSKITETLKCDHKNILILNIILLSVTVLFLNKIYVNIQKNNLDNSTVSTTFIIFDIINIYKEFIYNLNSVYKKNNLCF